MDKGTAYTIEKIINNWNEEFPNFTLEPDDLKKPHLLMEALVQLFNRLGIVKDFIISPPPEELCSESISYYWDLLPVINVTRLVNHIVVDMPQVVSSISIMHFLQPTLSSSRSIIMLLFNLMLFNEQRLEEIAPHEEKLFAKSDHVRSLEARKNELLEMLNKQAEEKGIRAEKIEKLTVDIKQLEEESTLEKQGLSQVQLEVESILKEVRQTELLLEQKKFQRDTLMSEVARKKALRVYDADDIKTQAEQASQNVQEAEEKLNSFRSTLMLKENSLKNLQTIKPSLDSAINTLHEIMKLTDTLKDFESGDLDTESKEGELDLLNSELYELQVQLSELQAARAETVDKRQESQAHRQSEMAQALSSLHEAEEKDKKCRSRCKRSAQRTEEIKHLTLKYEQEKSAGIDELAAIKDSFCAGIKTMENSLIQKAKEVEKEAQQKLRNRNL